MGRVHPVLERYSLHAARVLGELASSTRNQNLVVEDQDARLYVLRRCRRNPDIARIRFQIRFQQHVRTAGIPTSRVIEASSGEPLVTDQGDAYVLFTYVPGTEYDFANPSQAREASSWLARFHAATRTFRDVEQPTLDTIPNIRRWWTHGDEELARLEEFFHGCKVQEELALLRRWHRELVTEWPLRSVDALPKVWVHGDYHGRNIVFRGNRLEAICDFDVVHPGFRIEDVAYGLFAFSRARRGSHRIRTEVARLFLAAYDGVRPLNRHEVKALPWIAVAVHARTAARYALRRRLGGDPVQALKQHVGVMRVVGDIESRLLMPAR